MRSSLARILLLGCTLALPLAPAAAGEFSGTIVDPLGIERSYTVLLETGPAGPEMTLLDAAGGEVQTSTVAAVGDPYLDELVASFGLGGDVPAVDGDVLAAIGDADDSVTSNGRQLWRCPISALECFYELDRACHERQEGGAVWTYFNYWSGECVGACAKGDEVRPNCPRDHVPRY